MGRSGSPGGIRRDTYETARDLPLTSHQPPPRSLPPPPVQPEQAEVVAAPQPPVAAQKTHGKQHVKTARRLITEKNASAAIAALPLTFSLIDRSAKLGVIKKNTAARYKSKLHVRIKSLAT